MKSSEINLKPCPFCGKEVSFYREPVEATIEVNPVPFRVSIHCVNCNTMTNNRMTFVVNLEEDDFLLVRSKIKLSKIWNNRAPAT